MPTSARSGTTHVVLVADEHNQQMKRSVVMRRTVGNWSLVATVVLDCIAARWDCNDGVVSKRKSFFCNFSLESFHFHTGDIISNSVNRKRATNLCSFHYFTCA